MHHPNNPTTGVSIDLDRIYRSQFDKHTLEQMHPDAPPGWEDHNLYGGRSLAPCQYLAPSPTSTDAVAMTLSTYLETLEWQEFGQHSTVVDEDVPFNWGSNVSVMQAVYKKETSSLEGTWGSEDTWGSAGAWNMSGSEGTSGSEGIVVEGIPFNWGSNMSAPQAVYSKEISSLEGLRGSEETRRSQGKLGSEGTCGSEAISDWGEFSGSMSIPGAIQHPYYGENLGTVFRPYHPKPTWRPSFESSSTSPYSSSMIQSCTVPRQHTHGRLNNGDIQTYQRHAGAIDHDYMFLDPNQ
ncbi:hypothetical protein K440DRAFT_244127 [Wilcoxina mikolae CBS 423.85]|nr:hypothetical protein K440DRAFT_244127 [Wilcoxina mikolae CBS 423.85]